MRLVGIVFRGLGPGKSPVVEATMPDGTVQVWTSDGAEPHVLARKVGVAMGGAYRIAVKSCDGCPFEDGGDGRPFCKADGQERGTEPLFNQLAHDRPDWCPLELGPVTVEVEK